MAACTAAWSVLAATAGAAEAPAQVAFVRTTAIWQAVASSPDATKQTRLTTGLWDKTPALSLDGTRVAFSRYAHGVLVIAVARLQDGQVRELTRAGISGAPV